MKRSIGFLSALLAALLLLATPIAALSVNEAEVSDSAPSIAEPATTVDEDNTSENTESAENIENAENAENTENTENAPQLPEAADIPFIYDEVNCLSANEELRLTTWCRNVYEATGVAILYAAVYNTGELDNGEWCSEYTRHTAGLENGTAVIMLDVLEQNHYMVQTLRLPDFGLEALMEAYELGSYNCLDGVKGYMDEVVRQLHDRGYDITQDKMIDFTAVERVLPLVIDDTGILSDDQVAELNARADRLAETYQCEVALVLTPSLGGMTAQAWADDFYDYNGYGYGEEDSGILLAISVGDREYADTTYGYGLTAFTDNGLYTMEDLVVKKLKQDDWSGAAYAYYDRIEELLEIAATGEPFDELTEQTVKYAPRSERLGFAAKYCFRPASLIALLILSAPVGLIISVIKTKNTYREERRTVFVRHSAAEYTGDSFTPTRFEDIFINTTHSKVYKPLPKVDYSSSGGSYSSSSGRSGSYHGSSTHTSSSGRSHGGHSGRF